MSTVLSQVLAPAMVVAISPVLGCAGRRPTHPVQEWLHRRSGLVTAAILLVVGITLLIMGISELQTEGA